MNPSFTSRHLSLCAFTALSTLCLLGTSTAQGAKISLRNGDLNAATNELYAGGSDNVLTAHPNMRNTNYGRLNLNITSANSYPKGSIMQFDLSSLKGKVKDVKGATLRLTPHSVSPQPFPFSVYRVRPENAGWKEGTGAGRGNNPAKPGESTSAFKAKGAGSAANTPWHGGGTFGSGDYFPTPVFKGTFPANSTSSMTIELPAQMVLEWINNPSANAGIYILADVEASGNYGFIQNTAAGNAPQSDRPMLTIEY